MPYVSPYILHTCFCILLYLRTQPHTHTFTNTLSHSRVHSAFFCVAAGGAGGGAAGMGAGWGGGEGWANLGRGAGMHTDRDQLSSLNSDMSLDASVLLNSHISDNENISQFFQMHIQSSYHDLNSFISAYRNSSQPLMLSLNIQSLSSKYEHLKIFI
jgi:hypothetical protein